MLPKSYKGYTLIWRDTAEGYGGLLWTEIFIHKIGYFKIGYFLEEGVEMLSDGMFSVYWSPREFRIAGKRGLMFYKDKKNIAVMFQRFSEGKKRIQALESDFRATRFSRCSNQELFALYERLAAAIKGYMDAYLYNEPQFIWRMEEMIRDYIAKYEHSQEKQKQIFLTLMSQSKNSKDKKAIEQRRILKKFNFPSEIIQFIYAIQRSGLERFAIKKYERKIPTIRLPLLKETARRTHLSLSQLNALHYKELRDLLLKDKAPSLQEVNERTKNYFLYVKRKNKKLEEFLLSGVNAKKESHRLIKAVFGSSDKTLKGVTAYPGKIRGKARVFPFFAYQKDLAEHMKTMKDKEILVSVHTTPQMVPVVLKASAIVTDEGGINGHAAIVSREFKIPCVIGVGNGTERIKNGMELEVDATSGVVTIID